MNRLRNEMPVTAKWAYFDHAALAPLTAPAAQRMQALARESAEQGDIPWPDWMKEYEATRATAARMVGAGVDEIALVPSTTAGINLVSEGLDWHEGDNVVTLADEFPSNLYPWIHLESRGVETRRVETDNGRLDLKRLASTCDNRTRLVSVSWVGYQTGYRLDLDDVAQVAHSAGALFFVDAIQGLGVFPLDVAKTPIDFFSSGGQKWLLGPEGTSVTYIRREHLEELRPIGVGWNSVARPYDYNHIELKFQATAARFEGGGMNLPGLITLGKSLDLLDAIGASALAERILEYTDLACERLASAGAVVTTDRDLTHRTGEQRSGIVFFELPGRDPVEVRKECIARGIVLSCRAGKLRISPHAYNSEDDLERLIEVVNSNS
ncbi:MAG: aminotransferase class V-fold PLP-dependent enzyme [Aeoliella sp.]